MTTLAILGKKECPYSDEPFTFPKAKKRREEAAKANNQSELLSAASPGLKDEASNSVLLSNDGKSAASLADKSQHEGGAKTKNIPSRPKVNDI